eukprot:361140-Chlamydomonas_euryale.AAC.7
MAFPPHTPPPPPGVSPPRQSFPGLGCPNRDNAAPRQGLPQCARAGPPSTTSRPSATCSATSSWHARGTSNVEVHLEALCCCRSVPGMGLCLGKGEGGKCGKSGEGRQLRRYRVAPWMGEGGRLRRWGVPTQRTFDSSPEPRSARPRASSDCASSRCASACSGLPLPPTRRPVV